MGFDVYFNQTLYKVLHTSAELGCTVIELPITSPVPEVQFPSTCAPRWFRCLKGAVTLKTPVRNFILNQHDHRFIKAGEEVRIANAANPYASSIQIVIAGINFEDFLRVAGAERPGVPIKDDLVELGKMYGIGVEVIETLPPAISKYFIPLNQSPSLMTGI